ncbi:MAG: NUDIX hydrolase [Candidatus Kapabacteria bacterium]|nr:NUDIX hydrolase [Ignavibacteriota bacterium]MCW5884124.1 NUDIX hydrolase [Candidatus Kapabacteria bacterium]
MQIKKKIILVEIWQTLEDRFVSDLKIFRVRMKRRLNPLTKTDSEFVVLDSPNWVNIIPITTEGKIVMVEQYRHGTDNITLELPGGMAETSEDFSDAAMRECIEETGYLGIGKAEKIGEVLPNPAFLNNKCTTFVWKDCKREFQQNLDHNEIINIKEFSIGEVKSMIQSGKINHAIILNAFFFFFLKYDYLTKQSEWVR